MNVDTKAVSAEFIGTLALTLAVLLSINNPEFPIPTPVVAAVTLGLFVYTVGKYSGCNINPSVTLGLWATRQLDTFKGLTYLVAQFAGAGAAFLIALGLVEDLELLTPENSWRIAGAELLGAAILSFGVAAVVRKAAPEQLSGIVVGGSLFLGICMAAVASYGLLNPAVAVGTGSISAAYIIGPLVGGVLGASIYRYALAGK